MINGNPFPNWMIGAGGILAFLGFGGTIAAAVDKAWIPCAVLALVMIAGVVVFALPQLPPVILRHKSRR